MRLILPFVFAVFAISARLAFPPRPPAAKERSPMSHPDVKPLPAMKTLAEWEQARLRLREAWEQRLGRLPNEAPDSRIEVLQEETLPRVVRQRVRYLTEPGVWTEAYLLTPRGRKGRFPGVLVFHSTIAYNIRQPAGLEGPSDLAIGLHLAERGFVALCPRCFLFDVPGKSYDTAAAEFKQRHPGWTGMRKMLWDGERALDALSRLKTVDPTRLGVIGHSLGAKEALYLAAFDPLVRVAVFSEGGIGLSMSNWDAPWYLGEQVKSPDFGHDHQELLALIAPRPFLLLGGGSADGEASRPYVEAARPLYALSQAADRLQLHVQSYGHAFPPAAQAVAYEWLERYLKAK